MFAHLIVAALLASNSTGKTLVRVQQGTTVPQVMPIGPLILDDANTVCHATWNGYTVVDQRCAWAMAGTVPQVAKLGKVPAGAGAFADANNYTVGSGSDVMDFAGDFSLCVVYSVTAYANSPVLVSDGAANAAGYYLQQGSSGTVNLVTNSSGANSSGATVNTASLSTVNVACAGRSGTTQHVKLNLGTIASKAAATITAGTSQVLKMGRYDGTGSGLTAGTIYEVWASSTPASDALFTAVQQRVKTRLSITAW